MTFRQTSIDFWQTKPLLLFSLSFLLGIFLSLSQNVCFFSLLWVLYLFFLGKRAPLLFILAGFFYAFFLLPADLDLSKPVQGRFSLEEIKPYQTPLQKGVLHKGTLHLSNASIPCSIAYKDFHQGHLKMGSQYLVSGTLKQRGPLQYSLKPSWKKPLKKGSFLPALRYETKEKLKVWISEKIKTPITSLFFSALLTGDLQDPLLRYQFSRLGIQHILAVSGFHFGVLTASLSFLIAPFFSRNWRFLLLAIFATLYFLLIGSNPAVFRAWIVLELYLLGKFLKKNIDPLNLLGAALLIEPLFKPFIILNLGFQLSFASCLGILLFFPSFEKILQKALPKREPEELEKLSTLSKYTSYLASFLRSALSLTLAVNLFLFPLVLYHFHFFPFLGLFLNLFFPFCTAVCLFSFLIASLLQILIPLFGSFAFLTTDFFTSKLLDLALYPPMPLDLYFRSDSISPHAIPFYFFALLLFKKLTNREQSTKISSSLKKHWRRSKKLLSRLFLKSCGDCSSVG